MDNIKNDNYYIQKMKKDLEFIILHMKDVDIEELNAFFKTVIIDTFAREGITNMDDDIKSEIETKGIYLKRDLESKLLFHNR